MAGTERNPLATWLKGRHGEYRDDEQPESATGRRPRRHESATIVPVRGGLMRMATRDKPINGLMRSLLKTRSLDLAVRLPSQLKDSLLPRLWRLRQYEPRPIAVPAWYLPAGNATTSLHFALATPSFNQGRFIGRTVRS